MTRISLLLLLAVMASAMLLVNQQYESRRLFTELHRAQVQTRQLETEQQRLQVEKRAQATSLRVERMARDRLHMRATTPAITQYVIDDSPALAVPQVATAGGLR